MVENHNYNLMLQATEEHKGLWRINHYYKDDARNCKECQLFWEKVRKNKEELVNELQRLIKKHLS